MKIGILGTGTVGRTLGTKFVELGHDVKMGSRSATNAKAGEWVSQMGNRSSQGTFADAAEFGEIVFNCTHGMNALDALHAAGKLNLAGKVLIDVSNPLDFSKGFPPTLSVCNTDSLGEQIQRAFPESKVVKTLNTVNAPLMVNPSLVPGEHDLFMSGNNSDAKTTVRMILQDWFGWKNVIDVGDIKAARGMEQLLPFWASLAALWNTGQFNFHIVRA